jgi:hypothetical protein
MRAALRGGREREREREREISTERERYEGKNIEKIKNK